MKSLPLRYALVGFLAGVSFGFWSVVQPDWNSQNMIARYVGEMLGTGIAGTLLGYGVGVLKTRQLRRGRYTNERENPFR